MQALILAGGEGKRLRPLTEDKPKGMVRIHGKPLLEWVMEELPDSVTDIIIIIGYKGEKIREYFGESWNGHPLRYVTQEEQLGTWHAVSLAKDFITERFIMLYGDDIGDKTAFTEASQYDYCLLSVRREHPERYGVVELKEDGTLARIIEKPEHASTNLVCGGAMVLSPDMFSVEPYKDERLGEYLLVDLLSDMAQTRTVQVVEQKREITVSYPEDVAKAEALLESA